ncbi:MAG: fatty acid desaturase [Deltaproteobacteria bacterium]
MKNTQDWRTFTGELAWPTVALFLFLVAGHALTWWLVLEGHVPLLVGAALQTVFAYLAFTPLHEAVHGNIHGRHTKYARLDGTIGWVSAALLAAPYPAFRVLHLTHHSHTNDPERDPDHWVAGNSYFAVAARCFTIVPRYLADFFAGRTSKTKAARDGRNASALFFVVLALVLGGVVALGYGVEVIALYVAPAIVASGMLAFAFDWLPHHPHDVQGRYVDTRIVLFPGLGLLTLGQSYHTVHHLYPRVPFYRYAEAFFSLRDELEANGTPIVDLRG